MAESEPDQDGKDSQLAKDLLAFHDEFTAFNESCAFLCDAFAGIAANNTDQGVHSVRGLERSAYWLKNQSRELTEKFGRLQGRAAKVER